ncbi:MAG: hypothetical protein M3011_00285 [Actinomycetota bacterium]|nr:hypothetical protein [Actinomycetota bacterium]
MDRATVEHMREDAAEDLARPAPATPARQHLRALTDPRDAKIVALCDEILLGDAGMRAHHLAERIVDRWTTGQALGTPSLYNIAREVLCEAFDPTDTTDKETT